MAIVIDINSDVGERPEALADGSEEKLIRNITSANIACGGHAGDADSIPKVMKICSKCGAGIGAHPSFPDKESFGRKELNLQMDEITEFVFQQVSACVIIAENNGFKVRHVKPHGALYNSAVNKKEIAKAIALGIKNISREFILFGLAGSQMLEVWQDEGFVVAPEAFADRLYEDDGTLRSRKFPDSLITDPKKAAQQALKIAVEGKVISITGKEIKVLAGTICLHSDTKNSDLIASEIRSILAGNGVQIKSVNT